ncbi:MAG: SDR family oxidoreductase [Proteobacteria bacterium]|nr:SDR family oxidoreductase [Pseudomonadota bacterium]
MPTVLITGTSRGIGLEFVRQYAAEDWHVIAVARNPESDPRLREIKGDIDIRQADVTDHDVIDALAQELSSQAVDVLINNAGINGARETTLGNIDYEAWEKMFAVNVMAPMKLAESFVDHVVRSDGKTIICISSVVGSIARNDTGRCDYRASKTALNMVMRNLSADLRPQGIKVLSLHPGWVQTERNGPTAPMPLDESVKGMRNVIAGMKASDSGRFLNFKGEEYAW